jgi:acetylglutamate kinase
VVVAVLAGLVNKEIVASLGALGVAAMGLSGADGGILRARVLDADLGFVGQISSVSGGRITSLLDDGLVPVLAPIAVATEGERVTGQLLNVNADTVAGAIAAAIGARWLVFLTDVPGVCSSDGKTLSRLSAAEADGLMNSGVIEGGMIPKVQGCVAAARTGCESVIVDGREEQALLNAVEGRTTGTAVG